MGLEPGKTQRNDVELQPDGDRALQLRHLVRSAGVCSDCGRVQTLNSTHSVQLRFLGHQSGVSGADPEASRQRVRGAHAHPAHVFGTKLLPPGRRAPEVLVVVLVQSALGARADQVTVLVLQ